MSTGGGLQSAATAAAVLGNAGSAGSGGTPTASSLAATSSPKMWEHEDGKSAASIVSIIHAQPQDHHHAAVVDYSMKLLENQVC